MACNYYYSLNAVPPNAQVVDKEWVAANGGIDPDTATPAELATAGFYCYVQVAPPTYDSKLYSVSFTWAIVGTNASENWSIDDLPLATAKENCNRYVKGAAEEECQGIASNYNYGPYLVTAAAALAVASRPAELQVIISEMEIALNALQDKLIDINNATTVAQLAAIIA